MTLNMYDELMNLRITAHRSGYKDRGVSFAPRNSAVTYNPVALRSSRMTVLWAET